MISVIDKRLSLSNEKLYIFAIFEMYLLQNSLNEWYKCFAFTPRVIVTAGKMNGVGPLRPNENAKRSGIEWIQTVQLRFEWKEMQLGRLRSR